MIADTALSGGLISHLPEKELFAEARSLLLQLKELLETGESSVVTVTTLLEQLAQPFALFVCGEFNAGKSSLINRIAGEDIAETGILPTTKELAPLGREGLLFVDSPGTNSIIQEHQEVTEAYLKRSDYVLFVTSVERPLSDSELRFLRDASGTWKRKFLVVINKCDLLTETQAEEVKSFVAKGLERFLGAHVPIYLVSSRTGEGIDALVSSLLELLSKQEQVKAKVASPLRTGEVLLAEYQERIREQSAAAARDLKVFDGIFQRCGRRVEESTLLFEGFAEQGRALFSELAYRFSDLIDEHLGLFSLLKAKLTGKTEQYKGRIFELLSDLNFESRLQGLVDQAGGRLSTYQELLLADVRENLSALKTLEGAEASPHLQEERMVDPHKIGEELRRSAERGMNKFLAFGSAAAASGLGAKVSTVAPLEVTAMVFMVGLGFFTFRALPAERQRLKLQIEKSFRELGETFSEQLRNAIREQLDRSVESIRVAVAPSLESVKRRQEELEERRRRALSLSEEMSSFLRRVEERA